MNAFTFPFDLIPGTKAETAPLAPDRTHSFADALARALTPLADGVALVVSLRAKAPVRLSDDAVFLQRNDGVRLGFDLPCALAQAVASLRCGGSFVAASDHGASDVSPSVRRAETAIIAAITTAADRNWPLPGANWQIIGVGAPIMGVPIALTLSAPGLDLDIGFRFAAAQPAPETPIAQRADVAWQRGMQMLIGNTGLPVRAVLSERMLPLAEVLRLQPGDVLPLDTPREVNLRIGTHRLTRGTITPLGDDGGLIVTIGERSPVVAGPNDRGDIR